MKLVDFEKSYGFLQRDLEPLVKERDVPNSGFTGDGPPRVMSSDEVAQQWDEANDTAERRAMLREAIGTEQLRVLPTPKRHGFDPGRIILVPPDERFVQ